MGKLLERFPILNLIARDKTFGICYLPSSSGSVIETPCQYMVANNPNRSKSKAASVFVLDSVNKAKDKYNGLQIDLFIHACIHRLTISKLTRYNEYLEKIESWPQLSLILKINSNELNV
jgi:hypothetical protein